VYQHNHETPKIVIILHSAEKHCRAYYVLSLPAWPIYRPIFGFYRYIGLSRCWQNAAIFLTHAENLRKKAQRTKSRQLSCSNASRCVFQISWQDNYGARLSRRSRKKAPSLIRLIKNHSYSKILKLLQFEKF